MIDESTKFAHSVVRTQKKKHESAESQRKLTRAHRGTTTSTFPLVSHGALAFHTRISFAMWSGKEPEQEVR